MERYFLAAVLAAGCFLTVSCDVVEPAWSVALGNYSFVRGRYQQATIKYMEGLEEEEHEGWIYYNLGNVYNALGEGEAAFAVWDKAEGADSDKLIFRVYFNRGHLAYQRGEYRRAYENYREAVRRNPSSREAKVNLELSLSKLRAGGSAQGASGPAAGGGAGGVSGGGDAARGNHQRILEYVRKKEGRPWESGQEQESGDTVKDW